MKPSRVWRRLLYIARGVAPIDHWTLAALCEPPVSGEPVACSGCPLGAGGEWEAGLRAAIKGVADTSTLRRWGCHVADRPCAGMRRLLAPETLSTDRSPA